MSDTDLGTHGTAAGISRNIWTVPSVRIVLALSALVFGYVDLARGGVTISAALLSVGYLILVPIAIMAVPGAVPSAGARSEKMIRRKKG